MKHITFVTACYNEQGNISELYERIVAVMEQESAYSYELLIIDNCSTDNTRQEIRALCRKDKRVKAIFNICNFGPIRSGTHVMYQGKGDAVIGLVSDLEDPPELIPDFLRKWEQGAKIVLGVRRTTEEKGIFPLFRSVYYFLMEKISNKKPIKNATGWGLYDKSVMEVIQDMHDPYPYWRGLLCELGYPIAEVLYDKPVRKRGISSYNFFNYLDSALHGIISSSKLPLRLAIYTGGLVSAGSFLTGIYYFIQKLLFWDTFQAGIAPLTIGFFFLMGLLFMFLGILGEYVGLLVTHIVRRPIVIEEERINFEPDPNPDSKQD